MQPRNVQPVAIENKAPIRRTFVKRVNAVEGQSDEKEEAVFDITVKELCAIKRERDAKKNKRVVVSSRATAAVDNKSARPRSEGGLRMEDMKCFNCQEMGHGFRKCPKERVGKFCFRCGKPDVTTNDCVECPKKQVSCLDSESENQAEQLQSEQ